MEDDEKHAKWLASHDARVSSAGILLEDTQGRVLVVKANYKQYWTFPGGFIEKGETPKTAAIRETLEEISLTVHPDTLQLAVVIDRISAIAQTYQFIFRGPLEPGMADHIIIQSEEIDEWLLVTKQQVTSGDKQYAPAVVHWATDNPSMYIEHTYTKELG